MASQSNPASLEWAAELGSPAGDKLASEHRRSPRHRRAVSPFDPPPGEHWMTADEAAAHLGLPSRKALYAAVARGQIPIDSGAGGGDLEGPVR